MKKLLIAIGLFISLGVFGQCGASATEVRTPVVAIEYNQTTFNAGQSFNIDVNFIDDCGQPQYSPASTGMYANPNAVSTIQLQQGNTVLNINTDILVNRLSLPNDMTNWSTNGIFKLNVTLPSNISGTWMIGQYYRDANGNIGNGTIPIDIISTIGIETHQTTLEVKNVQYFNMMGQKVSEESEGLNIRITEYSDGSYKTDKVIK